MELRVRVRACIVACDCEGALALLQQHAKPGLLADGAGRASDLHIALATQLVAGTVTCSFGYSI
jgi:hypothetical protein